MSRKALGPSDPPQTPKLFELSREIRARPCFDPVQSAHGVVSHCQLRFASCAEAHSNLARCKQNVGGNGRSEMVGATGFEPAASRSRTERSTKLSHAPKNLSLP